MFSELIINIRKKKKINQNTLAKRIKRTQATIYKIETGKLIPSTELFIKLCEALKVSYEELKQLHIEYEKLIKPIKAKELLYKEFPKSEYIISLILENICFKEKFLELFKKTFDGNKCILFFEFLKQPFILYDNYSINKNENDINFNAKNFYLMLDIIKRNSKSLCDFKIEYVPSSIEMKIHILKELIKKIRNTYQDNLETIIHSDLTEHLTNEEKIYLKKILETNEIVYNNAIFDENLRINYRTLIQKEEIFYKNEKGINISYEIFFKDLIIYYKNLVLYLYGNQHSPIIIETLNGEYYQIWSECYFNEINLIDFLSDNQEEHIAHRIKLLTSILTKLIDFFDTEKIENNFIINFIEDLYYFFEHIFKELVELNMIIELQEDELKNLKKENQSLKQQIKLLEEELKKYKKEGKAGKD